MLSTPPDERGPDNTDRLLQMNHWREVIAWLQRNYAYDYQEGDLRTRFAIYHVGCLLADMVRQTRRSTPALLRSMPSVDWEGLMAIRVVLAHIPWRAESNTVWEMAERDVPGLQAELRRIIVQRPP
jgi:hypothetical protein